MNPEFEIALALVAVTNLVLLLCTDLINSRPTRIAFNTAGMLLAIAILLIQIARGLMALKNLA